MKLLITGSNGLVGSYFVENDSLQAKKTVILAPSKDKLNITDQKSVEEFFKLTKPDAIIHFAAFTDVSKAEEQRGQKDGSCWITNVVGTKNLIKASYYQPYFVYISTDVVFSGRRENPGPYDEDCPTEENQDFLSWYGWTKKEAEKLVRNNLKNAAILRIANPVRAKYEAKLDYVRKILELYDDGELYPMFDDQYLTLTYINEVTESLKILLGKKFPGIYHVSSVNVFTPYQLANLLIEKARGKRGFAEPISIQNFLKENPTRYPQYGGLKVEKTQKNLNLKFRSWQAIVLDIAKQLSA